MQPFFTAQRRDDIDASAKPTGLKRNPASVDGKRWFDVVCGVMGEPHRRAVGNLLDPDIQVAIAAAVGCIREEFSVRRDGGIVGPPDV